jgi:hypothetical protein
MLEQMEHRLRASRTFEAVVNTILDDVMALHGAEYGDLQLCCGGDVIIVAHIGEGAQDPQISRDTGR